MNDDELDPRLIEALGAAFARPRGKESDEDVRTGQPQRSEIHSAIRLESAAPVGDPPLRPIPSDGGEISPTSGKYIVQGEIARGGIGVVFKGSDTELGRDVALKYLHGKHCDNEAFVRRFIEEAQIGGQLQHPGIVPVYDVGQDGRRPYFTMKLVRGRTLAALLEERDTPARERLRFVQIFEQVCQTMAYAHARGVVHRDLKPANVMVGAFGEVQVVDWGLVKVLRPRGSEGGSAETRVAVDESAITTIRSRSTGGSDSIAGTVFGTPAYMAPEQALGDVERMDERADVFSLGAVLCEILTGQPPYVGATTDVLQRAARGDLDEALSRVRACGADSELIGLATDCLQASRDARPRSARVLAERLGTYIASVEQRVHEAELAATEERVRAKAARRSLRLTLGLAASIVLTLLIGGGTYLELRARDESRRTAIDQAVSEVRRLQGKAESAPIGEFAPWNEAQAALRPARSIATGVPEFEERLAELERELGHGYAAAKLRAKRQAADDRMRLRLAEIRVGLAGSATLDWAISKRNAYQSAFAEYEVDLAADDRALASTVRNSRLADELLLALDGLASVHATIGSQEAVQRLLRVAADADDDPWRKRFWDLRRTGEVSKEHVEKLAEDLPLRGSSLTNSILLSRLHVARRQFELAATRLRQAWHEGVSSTAIAVEASQLLYQAKQFEASRGFVRAALAQHPDSSLLWVLLGNASSEAGDHEEGLACIRKAIDLEPDVGYAWNALGVTLSAKGDHAAAVEALRKAVRTQPGLALSWSSLGRALMLDGKLHESIEVYRTALRLHPDNAKLLAGLGAALSDNGKLDEAEKVLRRAVKRLRADGERGLADLSSTLDRLASVFEAKGRLGHAIRCFEEMTRLLPRSAHAWTGLGTALMNRGETRGAVAAFRTALDCDRASADIRSRLADALWKNGEPNEAIANYRLATELNPESKIAWNNMAHVLLAVGRVDEAIAAYRSAIAVGEDARFWSSLGDAYAKKRAWDDAIAAHRHAIRMRPEYGALHSKAANTYLAKGDLGGAIRHYRQATRLQPDLGVAWAGLARSYREARQLKRALASCRKAVELMPRDPTKWLWMGLVARDLGRYDDALRFLRKAHELASAQRQHAELSADWVKRAERLVAGEERSRAIVDGEVEAKDTEELIAAANLAFRRERFARSVALFTIAFEQKPALLVNTKEGYRANAACAAAAAGSGLGQGAPEGAQDRARLRAQALNWLRTELEIRTEPERAIVERRLTSWLWSPLYAHVRDEAALEALEAREREKWQALWRTVRTAVSSR